ncbi:MAG: TatD family hydrolase [Treponema sp.]|nr:TatD family hydrolase [Treponema sp.]
MIDTHAHLSGLAPRGVDPHQTLRALFEGGFGGIIDISLEPGDLAERIREFSVYPRIRFASGLWPHAASIAARRDLAPELEAALRSAPPGLVCALGEFGLDHYRNGADHAPAENGETGSPDFAGDPGGERELMETQLDMARRLSLPVIIHSRDAPEETAEILAAFPGVSGVIHCYSYGPEELGRFLDLGYYISFAGNITYKNAQNIREASKLVPADRIFFETDCPYLAPVPHRGKPAHPGMVEAAYKEAAAVRGTEPEALASRAAANVEALFGVRF